MKAGSFNLMLANTVKSLIITSLASVSIATVEFIFLPKSSLANSECLPLPPIGSEIYSPTKCANWLPSNQSLNILDHASQIIRQDYIQMSGNNNSPIICWSEAINRVKALGGGTLSSGKRAIYYYHQDSDFLGLTHGDGHCYIWLYDLDAPRSRLLSNVLIGSVVQQVPAPLQNLFGKLPEISDAERKISGLHFRHFGFNATESSDVCLKKVNAWSLQEQARWSVWSHQINNCFGVISQYSFVPTEASNNRPAPIENIQPVKPQIVPLKRIPNSN